MTSHSGAAKPKAFSTALTRVGAVMTKDVVTLSPHNAFDEAIAVMANHPFRHLLVVEPGGHLVGVISDRDLLRALIRTRDWDKTTVAEVMTRDPVVLRLQTSLSNAIGMMLAHRVNCLPVTDKRGRVHGIVTSTDLLRTFLQVQQYIEQSRGRRLRRRKR